MKFRWILLVCLAVGCGPDGMVADDDDVSVDADVTQPDADPLAPDADPTMPDAAPGAPDAMLGVPDAMMGVPDATPLPPIVWPGLHALMVVSGISTCDGFPTPGWAQDMMFFESPPASGGYIYKYDPNVFGGISLSRNFSSSWNASFTAPLNIQFPGCGSGSCTFTPFTPTQTGANTWTATFIRNEKAGFGNPSAPCEYHYTINGTKLP